jgi:alkanesulfonate monooxygenase SsuD/methylene tetrahydromethanopterin reductase-like flavin-dependent oxidoreductase (luciferase family)
MAAAGATKRLRLGTGICLVIERDPITLAKEVASVDQLSNGRLIFGIGGGWNAEEMEHHGTVFKTRFKKMVEQVRAMKEIWTKDVAEFHGEHVNFEPIWCWPKPAQQPTLRAARWEAPHTLQRIVDHCSGWFPRSRNPEAGDQGHGRAQGSRREGRARHADDFCLRLRGPATRSWSTPTGTSVPHG